MFKIALNHVKIWTEDGWKDITIKEAIEKFGNNSTSSKSELLICGLCHQYVAYVASEKVTPYFKHSNADSEKYCIEKSIVESNSSLNSQNKFSIKEDLSLQLKIEIIDRKIYMNIGFIGPEKQIMEKFINNKFEIHAGGMPLRKYLFSELSPGKVTYLSVGSNIYKEYKIISPSKEITDIWNTKVEGVKDGFTIFDAETGIMIKKSSKIVHGKTYLLLIDKEIGKNNFFKNVLDIEEIKLKNVKKWYVYKIKIKKMYMELAEVFESYGYYLSDDENDLLQIWPLHKESDVIVTNSRTHSYLYMSRKMEYDIYPKNSLRKLSNEADEYDLLYMNEIRKARFVAIGTDQIVNYKYFLMYDEDSECKEKDNYVEVKDSDNIIVDSGNKNELPFQKTLYINSDYDYRVNIYENNLFKKEYKNKSGEKCVLLNIEYGMTIKIYIGMDCIWEASYLKESNPDYIEEVILDEDIEITNAFKEFNEDQFLMILDSSNKDSYVKLNRLNFIKLGEKYKNYKKVKKWIQNKMKNGYISGKQYSILRRGR